MSRSYLNDSFFCELFSECQERLYSRNGQRVLVPNVICALKFIIDVLQSVLRFIGRQLCA
jgi:hypothetical protein